MAFAAPKTQEEGLLKSLERLFDSDDTPGDFVLARLIRDAHKLMAHDAAAGHTVLAGVAALKWDVEAVRNHCRQAAMFDGSSAVSQNAAVNLRNVGLAIEAADHMLRAATVDPLNVVAQREAVEFLYMCGRMEDSAALMHLNIERGINIDVDPFQPAEAMEALKQLSVDEVVLVEELEIAYSVLREHRLRPRGFGFSPIPDPDSGITLLASINFHGDFTVEMKLESMLAEALVVRENWNPLVLSVEFEGIKSDGD